MNDSRRSFAPHVFLALGLFCAVSLAILIWPKAGYYILGSAERPLHPAHAFLRPSGLGGLSFGIAGTLLIFLNLTYLLRKRLISSAWPGSLRSWMSFHVFTGLLGALLVLLHSAFHPRSALGLLGFAALCIVVITGLLGRYIYAHTPRSLEGRELDLDDIRRDLAGYRAALEKLGTPSGFFKVPGTAIGESPQRGLVESILKLIGGDRGVTRDLERLRQSIQTAPDLRALETRILPLALRYARERQWLARYQELRSLMSGWRFLHRWLAVLLLTTAAFHVIVAWRMGNLWILSR